MSSPVTPGSGAGVAVQKKKSSDDLTDWRSKTTTLLSRASFLFNTPKLSDVKFIFKTNGGTEEKETIIYGHKLILAMASPVFDKMFFNQNPDLLTPVGDTVEMKDHPFNAEAFLTFMKFLYTDRINYEAFQVKGVSTELIFGILSCADYYDVPYLKQDFAKQLERIMTRTNVVQILEAALLFRVECLTRTALAFLDKNLKFLFESEEILSLKRETLHLIMNRDSLDLDEYFVLDLAVKWARHECKRTSIQPTGENKRKVLGPVFFEIRFALLTSDLISKLVGHNILTLQESLDICLAVHTPGHLTRTSTTPDGSKYRRSAPEVTFNSKPRVFGQRMEWLESKKMEEKWPEELTSLGKANLFMEGFPSDKTDFELAKEIERAGFNIGLNVIKLREDHGEFHVKFFYNRSVHDFGALLKPSTFGFSRRVEIDLYRPDDL